MEHKRFGGNCFAITFDLLPHGFSYGQAIKNEYLQNLDFVTLYFVLYIEKLDCVITEFSMNYQDDLLFAD